MSPILQPPPDVPAPPPGPEAVESREKVNLIYWIGLISVGALALMFLGAPIILRSRKATDRTQALNNIRQIGLSLREFEADFGRFPSAATVPDVKSRSKAALALGDGSSNQLFRQLLVTHLKSEEPFYVRISKSKRPDNRFSDDATALAKGECGFSYVTGLSSGNDPALPVVMTPMVAGSRRFSLLTDFGQKAIILRLDGSAKTETIKRNGDVATGGGRSLFDPSVWGAVRPDLRWPE